MPMPRLRDREAPSTKHKTKSRARMGAPRMSRFVDRKFAVLSRNIDCVKRNYTRKEHLIEVSPVSSRPTMSQTKQYVQHFIFTGRQPSVKTKQRGG